MVRIMRRKGSEPSSSNDNVQSENETVVVDDADQDQSEDFDESQSKESADPTEEPEANDEIIDHEEIEIEDVTHEIVHEEHQVDHEHQQGEHVIVDSSQEQDYDGSGKDDDEEEYTIIHEIEEDTTEEREVVENAEELIPDDYTDDDDGMETNEIILCVDTSAQGSNEDYEIIQPSVYYKKQNIEKPKVPTAIDKKDVQREPSKMVKLIYGARVTSEIEEERPKSLVMREIEPMTSNNIQSGIVKVMRVQNTISPAKVITSIPLKREREEINLDESLEEATELEVDANGVVTFRKDSSTKKKSESRTSGGASAAKSIACSYCNYRAPNVEEMDFHMNCEHFEEDERTRKRIKKRQKLFPPEPAEGSDEENSGDFEVLDETRESKNPNFECWRCNNRRFAGSGSLRRHINAVHLRLGNHPCQHCGKLFSAKHNLKVHTQTVHLRQRNYVCVLCNRTYTENRSLKRHIESSHAGQNFEALEYIYVKGRQNLKGKGNVDDDSDEMEVDENEDNVENSKLAYKSEDSYETDDQSETLEVSQVLDQESPAPNSGSEEVYVVNTNEKPKVVIYHDDSISASEEVVVGSTDMPIATEEVVITNNVDVPVEGNDEMETIEIKVELNSEQQGFYSVGKKDKIIYERVPSDDPLMISEDEVIVTNEEEVLDSNQVTVFVKKDGKMDYGLADSADDEGPKIDLAFRVTEESFTSLGNKRKPYQRIKCGYCGDFFCSRQLFYKHANKVHKDQLVEDWHCCPECRRFFPSIEAVKLHCSLIHANENKRTECSYCATMFTRTCTYYRHANQSHLDIISKTWVICDSCDLYMPDLDKLRQHQVHAHPPKKGK